MSVGLGKAQRVIAKQECRISKIKSYYPQINFLPVLVSRNYAFTTGLGPFSPQEVTYIQNIPHCDALYFLVQIEYNLAKA
jgi:hypothetical protein